MNRPEELLMEEGEKVGDGRAEGQAAMSPMLDIDGIGSDSLLYSVLSTLLKKK